MSLKKFLNCLKKLWNELLNCHLIKFSTYQSIDDKYVHELIGIFKQISNLLLSNKLPHTLILSEGRTRAFRLNTNEYYKILCFRQSKRLSKILNIDKFIVLGYDKKIEQYCVKRILNGQNISLFDKYI